MPPHEDGASARPVRFDTPVLRGYSTGNDEEDAVELLGKYVSYLGQALTLINWASPWTWLAVLGIVAFFYAANQ